MNTALGIIAVLIYFLAGAFIDSCFEEIFGYGESSALCVIFWPLVVLLFITLSLAYLFAQAGREIGNWINRWR